MLYSYTWVTKTKIQYWGISLLFLVHPYDCAACSCLKEKKIAARLVIKQLCQRFSPQRLISFCFRSAFGAGHVPRLSEMCVIKLQDNVDTITDTRGLDFDVLEPILERAKPETLMLIEDYNSYLTEYTGLKDKLLHLLYEELSVIASIILASFGLSVLAQTLSRFFS